jgi:hypothetical protein
MQYAQQDTDAFVLPNLIMSEDQSSATFKDSAVKDAFFGDCSDDDVTWAKSLLTPQAAAPLMATVETTPAKFGIVPKAYISCTQDKGVSPALQKTMYTNVPCETVVYLESSHSPFFSKPMELAGHLMSIV